MATFDATQNGGWVVAEEESTIDPALLSFLDDSTTSGLPHQIAAYEPARPDFRTSNDTETTHHAVPGDVLPYTNQALMTVFTEGTATSLHHQIAPYEPARLDTQTGRDTEASHHAMSGGTLPYTNTAVTTTESSGSTSPSSFGRTVQSTRARPNATTTQGHGVVERGWLISPELLGHQPSNAISWYPDSAAQVPMTQDSATGHVNGRENNGFGFAQATAPGHPNFVARYPRQALKYHDPAPHPTYIQEEYPFATAPPQVAGHPRQAFQYYDPAPYATYIREDAPKVVAPPQATDYPRQAFEHHNPTTFPLYVQEDILFTSAPPKQAVAEGYFIPNDDQPCFCGRCVVCINRDQQACPQSNNEHRIARAEQERRVNFETQHQTFVGYPEPRPPKRARFAAASVPQPEQQFVWQTPAAGYRTEEVAPFVPAYPSRRRRSRRRTGFVNSTVDNFRNIAPKPVVEASPEEASPTETTPTVAGTTSASTVNILPTRRTQKRRARIDPDSVIGKLNDSDPLTLRPACPVLVIELFTFLARMYLRAMVHMRVIRNGISSSEMSRIISTVREFDDDTMCKLRNAIIKHRSRLTKLHVAEGGLGGTYVELVRKGQKPAEDLDYTTAGWDMPIGCEAEDEEIDEPLYTLAGNIDRSHWPKGYDRGILTQCIEYAVDTKNTRLKMSDIPMLARRQGFTMPVESGNLDRKGVDRFFASLPENWRKLRGPGMKNRITETEGVATRTRARTKAHTADIKAGDGASGAEPTGESQISDESDALS